MYDGVDCLTMFLVVIQYYCVPVRQWMSAKSSVILGDSRGFPGCQIRSILAANWTAETSGLHGKPLQFRDFFGVKT